MSVLIAGNINVLDENDLLSMFPDKKIILLGKTHKHKRKIHCIDFDNDNEIKRSLLIYNVTTIIYFSDSVDFLSELDNELSQIRKIFNLISNNQDINFLYVTGPDSRFQTETSRSIIMNAYERLVYSYSIQKNISLKILRSLYMYQLNSLNDYLYSLSKSSSNSIINRNQKAYFIFAQDLFDLCRRILDNWKDCFEIIDIPDNFGITFSQLFELLHVFDDSLFSNTAPIYELDSQVSNLKDKYGWFPKVSILEDISTFEFPDASLSETKATLFEKIRELAKQDRTSVKFAILIGLIFLSELLIHYSNNQLYFKTVDYRLFAVVISGMSLGISYGIWASLFASIGLIVQNILEGETNFQTLFFEPTNWIPYIVYLVSGLTSGYVKEKDQSDLFSLSTEKEHLEKQLIDEQSFVEDLLSEKVDLAHQILERQDSYGKIYHFLKSLETPYIEMFLINLIENIKEIFSTEDVAIFKVTPDHISELILTTSKDERHLMLNFEQFEVIEYRLISENVWVNKHLNSDYPMYLAGIICDETVHYYISLDNLAPSKLNLNYQNILKSLVGLASLSYQRLFKEENRSYQNVMSEDDFYHKILALKNASSKYFLGRVLILNKNLEQIEPQMIVKIEEKLSHFDSFGQIGTNLCLLINVCDHHSLTALEDDLSIIGLKVVDELNIEESVEALEFKQMVS
jgi:hypothetical protein